MLARLALLFFCFAFVCTQSDDPDRWWQSANIYQISPVAFKDSDNDGFGDLQGIILKLDYLVETGVDVIFLGPFYKTPFKDFAYDVSDYIHVDGRFGTDKDIKELFEKAHEKGLKVIIDFIPNHTSDEHEWFIKSVNRERGYENYYVWHDGRRGPNGETLLPNNWNSTYGGSAWEWNEEREQFYYHMFAKEQPDLNLREQRVVDETEKILATWLELGADGFRIDAVSQLFEDAAFRDNPDYLIDLPQTYELVQRWRGFIDSYTTSNSGNNRVLVPQVWDSPLVDLMRYYDDRNGIQRAQIPTNFILINELTRDSNASDYKNTIDKYLNALPEGAVPNWFLGTHDHSRVASRFGSEKLDGLTMLLLTLPGVAFTYNGDEIGMLDHREISWEDTTDIWACNAGPNDFRYISRDPARTPFQWDGSTNAGFNEGQRTYIQVHPNYTTNNLALQTAADKSHYKFYKQLLSLRKHPTFAYGTFVSKAFSDNVFGYSRSFNDKTFVVLVNLNDKSETVNVTELTVTLENRSQILLASSASGYLIGNSLDTDSVRLDAFDALLLERYYSGATKMTISLLAFVMLLVKLF